MPQPTVELSVNDVALKRLAKWSRRVVEEPSMETKVVNFINGHGMSEAIESGRVARALAESDVLITDGISTVLCGRIHGVELKNRYSGIDFMRAVMVGEPARHYFVGGTKEHIEKIEGELGKIEGHRFVGGWSPPMWPWNDAVDRDMLEQIDKRSPHYLWVGLGAPKQELWINRYRNDIGAGLVAGVGYAFETFTNLSPMAPEWVRSAGLEWLYRLVKTPNKILPRVGVKVPHAILHSLLTRAHFIDTITVDRHDGLPR